jgi:hypothetical protein
MKPVFKIDDKDDIQGGGRREEGGGGREDDSTAIVIKKEGGGGRRVKEDELAWELFFPVHGKDSGSDWEAIFGPIIVCLNFFPLPPSASFNLQPLSSLFPASLQPPSSPF